MPRKSKDQRLAEVHALALQQFDDSYNATKLDRENARSARRFVRIRGAQWDWDTAGDFDNKMRMEIDLVSGAIKRIRNEYRANRIAANFLPADGSEADALADALTSRFRADTLDARGREARALAFDSALEGGFAGLRLRTEYDDEEKGYQRICVEPVNDAEATLFFDVNAKRKDKSDAEHAFLITPWSRRAFVAKYGEEAASWPAGLEGQYEYHWFGDGTDHVFVAEYFVKETKTQTYRAFQDPITEEVEEYTEAEITPELLAEFKATGVVEVEPRKVEGGQVRKYVLNGAKVLEDGVVIAGPNIPLIPQYGERTVIDHVERFRGFVLPAMDPQILYNLQISGIAETASVSSVEKPIFLAEQIGAYQDLWNDNHKNNNAFLVIDSLRDQNGNIQPTGPVGVLSPPSVPPAIAALTQITRQDVADLMGNPENAEQLQPDASGVAMDLVQGRIDMLSYGYMSEAADAERRLAEVYQGMAAAIYVEPGRKLKTLSDEGKRGTVEIGRPVLDPKTAKIQSEIDFSRARFDVEVDVGPTSASRRAAIVRTVASLMGQTPDPEMNVVLGHVALSNIEAEGMQDVRDWSRKKLLAMGVAKPTKEEQAEMQAAAAAAGEQQQPDPQAVLAGALAQEAQAKAAKAVADTGKAEAQTELMRAQTAETLASIPIAQQRAAIENAEKIMNATAEPPAMQGANNDA